MSRNEILEGEYPRHRLLFFSILVFFYPFPLIFLFLLLLLLFLVDQLSTKCLVVIFFLVNYFYYLIGHRLMGPVLKWFTPNLYDTRLGPIASTESISTLHLRYLKVLSADYYGSHYATIRFLVAFLFFFFFEKFAIVAR